MNLQQRFEVAQIEYASKIRTAAMQSSYVSRDHEVEDMEQELLVTLWECCSSYDPLRGAKFNSYFWMRARQRIGQVRARQQTQSRGGGAHIIHIDLDSEAIASELAFVTSAPSAEEEYLALEYVREAWEWERGRTA